MASLDSADAQILLEVEGAIVSKSVAEPLPWKYKSADNL
jgi:hypothetical protein